MGKAQARLLLTAGAKEFPHSPPLLPLLSPPHQLCAPHIGQARAWLLLTAGEEESPHSPPPPALLSSHHQLCSSRPEAWTLTARSRARWLWLGVPSYDAFVSGI
ncbi:hypothetical protein CLOM_g23194 [Closterium sp. NIES-68]|nr:hypothetical protein CLOM_g23194 [Closterium sp. NIES-68]